MTEPSLTRLLELVERELDAEDVRIEIGGRDPTDDRLLWCRLSNGWRLVATFPQIPESREVAQGRLKTLADTFTFAVSAQGAWPLAERPAAVRGLALRRLESELQALAIRAGAACALVIDESSPILWGSSEGRAETENLEQITHTAAVVDLATREKIDLTELLLRDAEGIRKALEGRRLRPEVRHELERGLIAIREESGRQGNQAWRRHLLTARAIDRVRRAEVEEARRNGHLNELVHGGELGYLARSFATIYILVLVFDGQFSELHAEAAVLHALPMIERLVLALPPVDPTPTNSRAGALRLLR